MSSGSNRNIEPFDAKAAVSRLKIALENLISLVIWKIEPEIDQNRDAVTEAIYDRQRLLSLGVDLSDLLRIVHYVWPDEIPPSRRAGLDRALLECEEWVNGLLEPGTMDGRQKGLSLRWTSYSGLEDLEMGIERHSVTLWP